MKKNEVFELTLTSVFVAIILMMSLVQQIGFITLLPGVAITLVHIPTLIGIFILKPKYGFILGLAFGIGSLIAAYLYGSQPSDLAFQNPLVSVLPRALFGLAAWGSFKGLQSLAKVKYGKYYVFAIVSVIAFLAIVFGARAIVSGSGNTNETFMLVITIIAIVIAVGFIVGYLMLLRNQKESEIFVTSSFIVGTLVHTILVLSAMALFSDVFMMSFADAVPVIFTIAAGNGLIEALAAALIGTPVYIALRQMPQLQARRKKV